MSKPNTKAFVAAISADPLIKQLDERKAQIIENSEPRSFGTRYGIRQDYLPITKHLLASIDRQITARVKELSTQYGVSFTRIKLNDEHQ